MKYIVPSNKIIFILLFAIFTKFNLLCIENTQKHDLAICALYWNEGQLLFEWLKYHKLLGFTKFYLLDDDSNDNTYEELKKYIDSGLVEYYKTNEKKLSGKKGVEQYINKQISFYNKILKKAQTENIKWLAFIDIDEFIYVDEDIPLLDMLNKLNNNNIAGFYLFWKLFGHNNINVKQDELFIEKLIKRCDFLNQNSNFRAFQYKSLVKPNMINEMGIHSPKFNKINKMTNTYGKNPLKTKLKTSFSQELFTLKYIYICHYVQRDLKRWDQKIKWKLEHHKKFKKNSNLTYKDINDSIYVECNEIEDYCMSKYVKKLKEFKNSK